MRCVHPGLPIVGLPSCAELERRMCNVRTFFVPARALPEISVLASTTCAGTAFACTGQPGSLRKTMRLRFLASNLRLRLLAITVVAAVPVIALILRTDLTNRKSARQEA